MKHKLVIIATIATVLVGSCQTVLGETPDFRGNNRQEATNKPPKKEEEEGDKPKPKPRPNQPPFRGGKHPNRVR